MSDRPELVIFCGLQAAGKTTFYRRHFAATHVHVSKDLMPHNRRKELRQRDLVAEALAAGHPVVVDNTNRSRAEREPLIALGRDFGAMIVGYFFEISVPEAIRRNATRAGRARVPEVGILATAKRLQPPHPDEAYDALFIVRGPDGQVEPMWPHASGAGDPGKTSETKHPTKGTTVTEHKGEELKGRIKEAGGDLTGNKDLEREGKVDESSAKVKDKVGDAADTIKDAVNPNR